MQNRFLYMKFLGLLLVIAGFSYCLTSFTNFFQYIFDFKIYSENLNLYLMLIGLIVPLFVFVYGVYFYFYTDFNITRVSKFLFITNISLLIIGGLMIILENLNFNFLFKDIFEFVHFSFGYVLIVLAGMGLYGCLKYKF